MKILPFSKTYQNRKVLSFPGFDFCPGKIYAVIGANGSGKSTFAKILSGTITPDIRGSSIYEEKLSVGYLPQKPYVFHMSVRQNLLLNNSPDKSVDEKRMQDLLEHLELTHLAEKKAGSLSGGETARMALARLMMRDYSLVILDEPCAAMDIASSLRTEELIRSYARRTGASIILITHSLAQARRISDEVLFFYDGTLLESGTAGKILERPERKETKEFLEFYGGNR